MYLIPVWFDEIRGHEGESRNGRPLVGPLTWYRAMVHSGESRAAIRQRHGCAVERGAVWLYDALCQMSAHQRISWRGTLRNQFGRSLTVKHLSAILEHPAEDIAALLAVLIECGWVADVPDDQVGTYYARRKRAAIPELTTNNAAGGEAEADGEPAVHQAVTNGAPDVRQVVANGVKAATGWRGDGGALEQSIATRAREFREKEQSPAAPENGPEEQRAELAAARNGSDRVFKLLRIAGVSARAARELHDEGVTEARVRQAVERCAAYRTAHRVKNLAGLLVKCLRTGLDEEWVQNGTVRSDQRANAPREPPR